MFTIGLSLTACLGWGIADFIGGIKSRQMPVVSVLMISNIFAVSILGMIIFLRGDMLLFTPIILWAVLGGLVSLTAMFLFFRALSVGSMAVVTPISACGVILPVIWGYISGDSLTTMQSLGIISAILGSILLSRDTGKSNSNKKDGTKGVVLAIFAAIFVGLYFITMDQAAKMDPCWASFISRISYWIILGPVFFIKRPPVKITQLKTHFPAIIAMGTIDALAGFAFVTATSIGLLSIVAVIGSLYPAITIILSILILRERPRGVQSYGAGLALMGIVLVAL